MWAIPQNVNSKPVFKAHALSMVLILFLLDFCIVILHNLQIKPSVLYILKINKQKIAIKGFK